MTFEEMMQAVDLFRSWPLDVQQYCVKIAGYRNLQPDEYQQRTVCKKISKSKPSKHNLVWSQEESLQLLTDVELIGSAGVDTWRSLSAKYGRTPGALQDQWYKLQGKK